MFRAVPPAPNTPVSAAPPSAACPVGTRRFAQAVAMLRPRWNRRVGNRGNVSNCIESQACCCLQGSPVRAIELSMVSSLWAQAMRASFGGLPRSRRRV